MPPTQAVPQHRWIDFHPREEAHFLDLNYSRLQAILPPAAHSVD
jgi:hypothetical protein